MFGLQENAVKLLDTVDIMNAMQPFAALVILQWLLRDKDFHEVVSRRPAWLIALCWALMLIVICLMQGVSGAFIYFQF